MTHAAFFVCVLLFASVHAESIIVDPPSDSVEVKVGAFLIDITKIDGPEQMYNADVLVRLTWTDPRLADATAGTRRLPLDEIWTPRMTIANYRDVKLLLPKEVKVSATGEVVYRQRAIGDFTSRLDLRNFPMDSQTLGVHVVAQGYNPQQVRFVNDPSFTGRAEDLTITDWTVGEVIVKTQSYSVPRLGEIAGVTMEFETKRHSVYYVATILASAIIIVCMAWMVFWMPPEAVNPRISISVTSMLTLIAHRFVVASELPRLSYLTQLDYFLLGSTFMVLLGLIGVVAVARVTLRGNPELGIRLNGVFRWVYPIVFLSLLFALS